MEYVKRGLLNTAGSIRKHKLLFVLLVILQVVFVVSSLALGSQYLLKILENAQGIIVPLENANYDSEKIEQGKPLAPDYASIYNSYRSMLKNVFSFLIWMSALFLFLNGSVWLLSHWMLLEKQHWKIKAKEGIHFFLKAWASALLLLGPFAIISYYVLIYFVRTSSSFGDLAVVLKSLSAVLFVINYFLLAALAVAGVKPWKKFFLTWIEISIKRLQKTAVVFFFIIVALLLSFGALYGAVEYGKSVTLLLVLGLLCMVIISLTRIFWIATVQEITSEKKDETSNH